MPRIRAARRIAALIRAGVGDSIVEHGFEGYAADILRRLLKLGRKHKDHLPCTFTGAMEPEPKRS